MDKYCSNCGGNSCGYGRVVRQAYDKQIKTKEYYNLIWYVLLSLQLNRRKTRDKVVDVLCQYCCITLQNAEGKEIVLPEFDDVFPEDESCRWFGRFLETDPNHFNLSRRYYCARRYNCLYIPTLRVLDVAAKILEPEPFRKIGQIC